MTLESPPDPSPTLPTDSWVRFLEEETPHLQKALHAPGIAAALITGSDLVFNKTWGLANIEDDIQLTPNTPIRAGSISKVVTAVAIQQLVESGALNLDTEIQHFVDKPLPHDYGKAQLRELLTHRSGIGERFAAQTSTKASDLIELSTYLHQALPPPVAPLSETVTYSNFGISLLGLAVEKTSGQTFADYAKKQIFQPLGMETATFIPSPETDEQTASGYIWIFNGHRHLPLRHWKPYPASSLVATPRELAIFMQSLLKTNAILKNPNALFEEQCSPVPGVPGMGLGFWLDETNGQRVAWHTGHMPGHRTGFYIFPDKGFGLLLYYNTDEKKLRYFLDRFCNHAFAKSQTQKTTSTPNKAEIPKEFLHELSGTYRHSWYPHHHFGKSSAFLGKEGEEIKVSQTTEGLLLGNENYQWISGDIFENQQQKQIGFIRNKSGKVNGLYLSGRDRFEKITPWETRKAHTRYIGASLAIFAILSLTILINLFLENPFLYSTFSLASLILSFINLAFVGSMTAIMAQGAYKVTQDMPRSLALTLALPLLGIPVWIFTLGLVLTTENLTIANVILLATLSLGEILFLHFLNYWKLLGWRY